MYKLNVTSQFSAAHQLKGYEGACKNLHGHNWKVRVGILCEKTDDIGMTIDFGIVKEIMENILAKLDHSLLNDHDCFAEENPTSENIAQYLYVQFKSRLTEQNCQVADVEVWESDRSSMVYFE
ncbi:MAG: 6-carboxytetrahydropterin synthase QueD [Candidatus Cloacimonetes bacterium]|nr:6-carboxytetrahydropterin synthase QueD [Candidatus Cloacimonadota bacterium]